MTDTNSYTINELLELFPKTMKLLCTNISILEALEHNKAAIMPIYKEAIVHNNTFAEDAIEIVTRVDRVVSHRLDKFEV